MCTCSQPSKVIYKFYVTDIQIFYCVQSTHLSISLLLFEAEVLPEAADGGLDTRFVLVIGGGDFLPRTHRLFPQSAGPGWTQRSHLCCLTRAAGVWL